MSWNWNKMGFQPFENVSIGIIKTYGICCWNIINILVTTIYFLKLNLQLINSLSLFCDNEEFKKCIIDMEKIFESFSTLGTIINLII